MNDDARAPRRVVCVVLHDVAPARWFGCLRVLAAVDEVAWRARRPAPPVTLLVVPRLHGADGDDATFLRWLRRQQHAGHELALHGWTHRDEAPPPRTLAGFIARRCLTDGEGEFAALGAGEAAARIAQGRAWAEAHGLRMHGFVAPAWQPGRYATACAADAGYAYTCTRKEVLRLPQRTAVHAETVAFSSRAAWRRTLSLARHRALGGAFRRAGVLRFELHPDDADHREVRSAWSRTLFDALRERQPVTLGAAASGLVPAAA